MTSKRSLVHFVGATDAISVIVSNQLYGNLCRSSVVGVCDVSIHDPTEVSADSDKDLSLSPDGSLRAGR